MFDRPSPAVIPVISARAEAPLDPAGRCEMSSTGVDVVLPEPGVARSNSAGSASGDVEAATGDNCRPQKPCTEPPGLSAIAKSNKPSALSLPSAPNWSGCTTLFRYEETMDSKTILGDV